MKTRAKYLGLVLLFVTLLAAALILNLHQAGSLVAEGTSTPMLIVSAPSGPLEPGDTITVTVTISNAVDLAGFEFDLDYNPALLEVTGYTPGDFLGPIDGCDADNGRCAVALTSTNDRYGQKGAGIYSYGAGAGASGSGILGAFTMRSTGATGDTELALRGAMLVDTAAIDPTFPAVQVAPVTIGHEVYLPTIVNGTGTAQQAVVGAGPRQSEVTPATGTADLDYQPPYNLPLRNSTRFVASYSIASTAAKVAGMNPDVNLDAAVDVLDIQQAAACWNQIPTAPGCGHNLDLNLDDLIDTVDLDLIAARWRVGLHTIDSSSPAAGERDVAVTRESIVVFTGALDPATVTTDTLQALFGGQILPGRLHLAPNGLRLTHFYSGTLPPSARVRLTLAGDQLVDSEGYAVDADGDGLAGGSKNIDFDTLSLTVVPGTVVCGRVIASELADDGSGGTVDIPLEGATITVDGLETTLFAGTDANGDFCLDPAPSGKFYVHVDGRTASNGVPPGAYYPYVGKPWTSTPGQTIDVGVVHLPLVRPGTLQPVSQSQDTTIHMAPAVLAEYPEFDEVQITVPADSLYANDGSRGGQVGIAPVPPDRLPGRLPRNLRFPIVITVQTDGATNFDTPAPVCFPNLPDPDTSETLLPGEKSALMSFNHDSGRWELIGSMSVSDDGTLACSDPGVGILAPGWHGTQQGAGAGGGDAGGGDVGDCGEGGGPPPPPPPNGCGPAGYGLIVPEAPGGVSFTSACNTHDVCYAICGADKSSCDNQFLGDMTQICNDFFAHDPVAAFNCRRFADLYWHGVSNWGGGAFEDAQEAACGECSEYRIAPNTSFSALPASILQSSSESNRQVYAIYDENRQEIVVRGVSGDASQALTHDEILAPNTAYQLLVYRPDSKQSGIIQFTTPGSGKTISLPPITVRETIAYDMDNDGLTDDGEAAIGTDLFNYDTDSDGIGDGSEVDQGTNPLDGIPARTGIIASADTPGETVDVCALNGLAIVADGNAGISVFSVTNRQNPTAIAQVDTPGEATRVTCATDVVAVADGSAGLAIVDIGDPPAANIMHQVALGDEVKAVVASAGIVYAGAADGSVTAVNQQDGAIIDAVNIGEAVLDLRLGRDVLYAYAKDDLYTISLLGGMAVIDVDNVAGTYFDNETRPLRLFVGDDVAYAVHRTGYNTFDLSDPANPAPIANGDTAQFGWRQIVDNGSGLGLAAVGPNSNADPPHNVSLYDVSDPAQTNQFLTEFATPGLATAVSIYNGLAYVADGEAGLQVINYLAYDALGNSPTITTTTNAVSGTIEEGQVLHFNATVNDDVQVRNVTFYVDGAVAAVDGNYPFGYRFITPLTSQQTTMTLTAKATDTGGNLAWAAPITLTIAPDNTPPTVGVVVPAEGVSLFDTTHPVTAVSAIFYEPVDPATLTADSYLLVGAGADGAIGTGDDTQVLSGTISYHEPLNMALMTFPSPLPPDQYTAIISGTVADMAGNAIGTPFSWQFEVTDGDFGDWTLSRTISFASPQAAHYNPVNGLIYVGRRGTASDGLYRIESDGSATKVATGSNVAGVAVDHESGRIFFSEDFGGVIYRVEITGTGRTTWVSGFHSDDDDPVGMDFAPALYSGSVISPGDGLVVDRGSGGLDEVWRFSPDVAQGETAVHSDDGTLVDSVDLAIGLDDIYLVDDKDAGDGVIYRLNTGGSLTLITTTLSMAAPEGITIDPLTGNLLIQDIADKRIYSVDPATGVVVDALAGFSFVFPGGSSWAGIDISPDGQRLIITDKGPGAIYVFTRSE